MHFRLLLQVELPFVVNLPSQKYTVLVSPGRTFELDLDNECHAAGIPTQRGDALLLGRLADMSATLSAYSGGLVRLSKLRTVVSHTIEIDAAPGDLPPAPPDLMPTIQRELLLAGHTHATPEESREAAEGVLLTLPPEQQADLRLREQQLAYARQQMADTDEDLILAVNRLIRWYSTVAEDFFVEEVGLHQLASTTTKGVLRSIFVDNRQLECVPVVGKVPPLMRSPWMRLPQATVDVIAAKVAQVDDPDFVKVLEKRARYLLERTAFRNAVAEAAAALEVSIARAIARKMRAALKTDAEIDAELESTNMNFPRRAEVTLKNWCGRGTQDLDNAAWTQIKVDRKNVRNAVVHGDREPSKAEAEEVVERFLGMTALVQAL